MFTPAALSCIEFVNVRDGITKSDVPSRTARPMPFVTRQLSGMKPPYMYPERGLMIEPTIVAVALTPSTICSCPMTDTQSRASASSG